MKTCENWDGYFQLSCECPNCGSDLIIDELSNKPESGDEFTCPDCGEVFELL